MISRGPTGRNRVGNWLDGFAVCASFTCIIHCLAMPLIVAALPTISTRLGLGEGFHALILILAVPTSAVALIRGWRQHQAFSPMMAGIAGLALMTLGLLVARPEVLEIGVTVAGSLLLATAHIVNWRARRPCL